MSKKIDALRKKQAKVEEEGKWIEEWDEKTGRKIFKLRKEEAH